MGVFQQHKNGAEKNKERMRLRKREGEGAERERKERKNIFIGSNGKYAKDERR